MFLLLLLIMGLVNLQLIKNDRSKYFTQGSYRPWKTWKVIELRISFSRPGKSWNLIVSP